MAIHRDDVADLDGVLAPSGAIQSVGRAGFDRPTNIGPQLFTACERYGEHSRELVAARFSVLGDLDLLLESAEVNAIVRDHHARDVAQRHELLGFGSLADVPRFFRRVGLTAACGHPRCEQ